MLSPVLVRHTIDNPVHADTSGFDRDRCSRLPSDQAVRPPLREVGRLTGILRGNEPTISLAPEKFPQEGFCFGQSPKRFLSLHRAICSPADSARAKTRFGNIHSGETKRPVFHYAQCREELMQGADSQERAELKTDSSW